MTVDRRQRLLQLRKPIARRTSLLPLLSNNQVLCIDPVHYTKLTKTVISYARESIVTVIVGSARKEFSVPEGLLRSASDYFSNALSGQWREANTKTFELPKEHPAVFQLFVHHLYHAVIKVNRGAIDTCSFLIEAWLFGERHGALRF